MSSFAEPLRGEKKENKKKKVKEGNSRKEVDEKQKKQWRHLFQAISESDENEAL